METALSYKQSFKAYRDMLCCIDAPAVTYLGVLFRDLLYQCDGPMFVENKHLKNVYKLYKTYDLIYMYHMKPLEEVPRPSSPLSCPRIIHLSSISPYIITPFFFALLLSPSSLSITFCTSFHSLHSRVFDFFFFFSSTTNNNFLLLSFPPFHPFHLSQVLN